MPVNKKIIFCLLAACSLWLAASFSSGCGVYKFADVSVPDSIKTVRVKHIENKARYVNPQLSPQFTDKLRQKIVSQTKLTQVNNENAHWEISGEIRDYTVTTSAISSQSVATNRLTVGIHIILNRKLENKVEEYDISRSFDFAATLTLQQAEASLNDEMIRNLVDEVFNRIFSKW